MNVFCPLTGNSTISTNYIKCVLKQLLALRTKSKKPNSSLSTTACLLLKMLTVPNETGGHVTGHHVIQLAGGHPRAPTDDRSSLPGCLFTLFDLNSHGIPTS